jgi:hypothetical protein
MHCLFEKVAELRKPEEVALRVQGYCGPEFSCVDVDVARVDPKDLGVEELEELSDKAPLELQRGQMPHGVQMVKVCCDSMKGGDLTYGEEKRAYQHALVDTHDIRLEEDVKDDDSVYEFFEEGHLNVCEGRLLLLKPDF